MIKGDYVLMSIDDKIAAAATGLSLSVKTATKQVTTFKQMPGGWDEFIAGNNSWDGGSDNMVVALADVKSLITKQATREPVAIKFVEATVTVDDSGEVTGYAPKEGGFVLAGKGYLTSMDFSAPADGECTTAVKIQGTGPLS